MVAYRYEHGSSSRVAKYAPRHIRRLGKITRIIGYRFFSKRTTNGIVWSNTHERVKFIGENGYCIFDGVCWGYSGQGPRTLRDLLMVAGIQDEIILSSICFNSRRNDKVGIDWEICIDENHIKFSHFIPNTMNDVTPKVQKKFNFS